MNAEILTLGVFSLAVWLCVVRWEGRNQFGWASPGSLFALGLIAFYILPPIYWQFRTWTYWIPSYFEGLPRVLVSSIVLSTGFVAYGLFSHGQQALRLPEKGAFGPRIGLFLIPSVLGILWRVNLLQHGFQGRLAQQAPELFGSEALAYLMSNISYYYPIGYFALVGMGTPLQRRLGMGFWAFDGLFQLILLHRYELLIFMFRSLVFTRIAGWRIAPWRLATVAAGAVAAISIIGQAHQLANVTAATAGQTYLSVRQVADVLADTSARYLSGNIATTTSSVEGNAALRSLDDAMFRLYDARSASAVMEAVPDILPYYGGRTFLHIFYALIPRFFWPEKPNLAEIHYVTTMVMPGDSGINPTGTLAEFYLNYGLVAVFLGGVVCWLIVRWHTSNLSAKGVISPTVLCTYPIIAELYFASNLNFTQRVCEGLRFGLVAAAVYGAFQLIRPNRANRATPSKDDDERA